MIRKCKQIEKKICVHRNSYAASNKVHKRLKDSELVHSCWQNLQQRKFFLIPNGPSSLQDVDPKWKSNFRVPVRKIFILHSPCQNLCLDKTSKIMKVVCEIKIFGRSLVETVESWVCGIFFFYRQYQIFTSRKKFWVWSFFTRRSG